jgi:hypothetical protein
MTQLKKFSLMVFFIAAFSFSGISIAEQTSSKECAKSCEEEKQVCFNLNPDRRLCENQYQNCLASCKEEDDSSSTKAEGGSSSSQKGTKSSSLPK